VYDDSWAFQHGRRLDQYRVAVHAAWAVLLGAMRLGGSCFELSAAGAEILNRNLLVLARR
jgi:hypothetical protein